jgi:hypothetical protein
MVTRKQQKGMRDTRWLTMALVTVTLGIAAGLGATGLGLLLHFVQHIAYGYSLHAIISRESFLHGVRASSPARRLVAQCACGSVAGIGWWTLYRFGTPLVSIRKATEEKGPRMNP